MPEDKEMTERLLDAITVAIRMIEQQNYGMALKRLRRAKLETEKLLVDAESQNPPLDNPAARW